MIDSVTLWGAEPQVTEQLEGHLSLCVTEVMASPLLAGSGPKGAFDCVSQVLGRAGLVGGHSSLHLALKRGYHLFGKPLQLLQDDALGRTHGLADIDPAQAGIPLLHCL